MNYSKSQTQREEILSLLRSKSKVPSYELARIALQYNARILELRRMGFEIRNETQTVDGQKHGTFTLVSEPEPFRLESSVSVDTNDEPQPTFISTAIATNYLDYEMGRRRAR